MRLLPVNGRGGATPLEYEVAPWRPGRDDREPMCDDDVVPPGSAAVSAAASRTRNRRAASRAPAQPGGAVPKWRGGRSITLKPWRGGGR
jgi:hypothetical protein